MSIKKTDVPNWIQRDEKSFFSYHDFRKIYEFFVLLSPVPGCSARGISLKDYGWKDDQRSDQIFIELIKLSNLDKPIFELKNKNIEQDEILIKLKEHGLEPFPPTSLDKDIVFINISKNRLDSMLKHIRNSFAHGRFSYLLESNKRIFIFEDICGTKITARMILKQTTLNKWIDYITSGPQSDHKRTKPI